LIVLAPGVRADGRVGVAAEDLTADAVLAAEAAGFAVVATLVLDGTRFAASVTDARGRTGVGDLDVADIAAAAAVSAAGESGFTADGGRAAAEPVGVALEAPTGAPDARRVTGGVEGLTAAADAIEGREVWPNPVGDLAETPDALVLFLRAVAATAGLEAVVVVPVTFVTVGGVGFAVPVPNVPEPRIYYVTYLRLIIHSFQMEMRKTRTFFTVGVGGVEAGFVDLIFMDGRDLWPVVVFVAAGFFSSKTGDDSSGAGSVADASSAAAATAAGVASSAGAEAVS
jgi:hypothetical protein